MASERKISEGVECIRNAEKYLKTSFMKWKPDYDSAASEYSKAATCFRTAKVLDQCKDALMKAAECYSQNHSYFSAAKSFEQAGLVCKEMDDYMGAARMIEKAAQLFQEHGTPDTAALALEKGAKMVESKYPEVALDLYRKAADVVMIESRPRQAAEYTGKAARILTKLKRYDDASDMLKKEMEYHVMSDNTKAAGRLVISLVLVHLMREDYVAAEKAFQEGYNFMEREECQTMSELLQGYDQGDSEQLNRALNHPFIKYMDVEYARLARLLQSVPLPTSGGLDNYADTQDAGGPSDEQEKEDISGLL